MREHQRFNMERGFFARAWAGFSLIELLIALVLSTLLIGAVTVTFISASASSREAEQLARTQENMRFASDFIVRDIRNAGFRDQVTLTPGQYRVIGQCFAKYGSVVAGRDRFTTPCVSTGETSELTIRYAGRGACGLAFENNNELKMIENTYLRNAAGELVCNGTEIGFNVQGNPIPVSNSTVVLAAGLTDLNFTLLFADASHEADVCDYFDEDALETACLGVEIEMTFAGQPNRTATITAAFRNVILDQLYGRE